jgi:hypothetical protein
VLIALTALTSCVAGPPSVPTDAPSSPGSSATPSAQPTVSDRDVLARAATKRVFFAHQSVGANVLEAVSALYDQAHLDAPEQVWVGGATDVISPAAGGVLAETLIGENGDPDGKVDAFAADLRGGIGSQVKVAVIKYCYADLSEGSDVEARFAHYRSVMRGLEADFPEVTFLYATDPVTTGASADNVVRTRFNTLMREAYGASGRLWDVAAAESTRPDGTRVTGSVGGQPYEALFDGYSSDGGHPNAAGSRVAALALLHLIAATG